MWCPERPGTGALLEELPKSAKLNLPGEAGTFTYIIDQKDGQITLNCPTQLNQLHWSPEEYPTLHDFFRAVAEKQGEQIVLRKQ